VARHYPYFCPRTCIRLCRNRPYGRRPPAPKLPKNGLVGARVHGGFGAFISLGIKIGLDALNRLDASPEI
jgi:hypothetical protein